jgi:conjugal transfer pilin signal peptidase TrbI
MCTKTVKKVSVIVLGLMLAYGYCAHSFICVFNTTESLPYRFFVLKKRNTSRLNVPHKESYIYFTHEKTNIPMIKQVKGVPGSRIHLDATKRMWVDDFCIGIVQETTSTGTPLSALCETIVPAGYVFVYATHIRSFDSRYCEMGLVPVSAIKGSGIALL